ncbi:hypothetical protein FB566_3894 [Stackebrandtia endophytica]|uniref:Uncharacterized protein n=1 Tax=Stackebrandtia endophytica TaxID=1496996 RepID=A0A543B0E9_9ACTN|nr:hypothetical protein FB566_3894 [Stackebrandtia endophytica]
MYRYRWSLESDGRDDNRSFTPPTTTVWQPLTRKMGGNPQRINTEVTRPSRLTGRHAPPPSTVLSHCVGRVRLGEPTGATSFIPMVDSPPERTLSEAEWLPVAHFPLTPSPPESNDSPRQPFKSDPQFDCHVGHRNLHSDKTNAKPVRVLHSQRHHHHARKPPATLPTRPTKIDCRAGQGNLRPDKAEEEVVRVLYFRRRQRRQGAN